LPNILNLTTIKPNEYNYIKIRLFFFQTGIWGFGAPKIFEEDF
jgi:hypothetical protein